MTLPAQVQDAIRAATGAITLIVGAGCSHEAPTDLPLAGDLSEAVHQRLLDDGVLASACARPRDLTCVADAVYALDGSQSRLVERLPLEDLRNAEPNQGYLLAAALLAEDVVSSVVTLNYDLALEKGPQRLGVDDLISVVSAPADFVHMSQRNIVYLHRNVRGDPDTWIMRSEQLESDWKTGWEAIIAGRTLAGPVTIFVGLASDAKVLTDTMNKISAALGEYGMNPYFVDPAPLDGSSFASTLGIQNDHYLPATWGAFMAEVADFLAAHQAAKLQSACADFETAQGIPAENHGPTIGRLRAQGLLAAGSARSRWTLNGSSYLPFARIDPLLIADLVSCVCAVERVTGTAAEFDASGIVSFRSDDRRCAVLLVSGRGTQRWSGLEARLLSERRRSADRYRQSPRAALVAGVPGGKPALIAPPADITGQYSHESILLGPSSFELFAVDDVRADPELARRLVA